MPAMLSVPPVSADRRGRQSEFQREAAHGRQLLGPERRRAEVQPATKAARRPELAPHCAKGENRHGPGPGTAAALLNAALRSEAPELVARALR